MLLKQRLDFSVVEKIQTMDRLATIQAKQIVTHIHTHTYILYYSSQRGSSAINTQIIIIIIIN